MFAHVLRHFVNQMSHFNARRWLYTALLTSNESVSSWVLFYIQDCPEEVFLEAVLMPSLERGRLGMLQTQLEALDPTLEGCSRYLIAACQLLQRRGHFHTLYQLQQFMTVRSTHSTYWIRLLWLNLSVPLNPAP